MYRLKIAGTDQVSFGPVPVLSDGSQSYLEHCKGTNNRLHNFAGCRFKEKTDTVLWFHGWEQCTVS